DSVVRSTEDQFRVRGTYDLGGGWTARGLLALLVDEEDASRPDSFLVDETGAQSFIGIAGVRQGVSNDTELLLGVGLSGEAAGWDVDVSLSRFDVLRARDRQSDNFDTTTGLAPLTGQVTDGDNTSWNSLETIAERQLGAHALAAGFSYAGYSFDTPRFTTLNWRTAERAGLLDASGGETRLYGLFLEDAITLSGQWTLTLGVRAEAWEAEDGFLQTAAERVDYASRSDEAFSPKGALTFRPAPDWSFTASAALATRFPTVQELFQPALISFGPNVGDLDFGTFDPELKPEEALDIQFTIEKTFERAFFAVSLFRQDVDDTIFAQTVPELGTSLLTNIDNVTTNGIDFVAATEDLFIDGLAIDANLSLLDAEIKENAIDPSLVGNRFPRIPDLRANASIRYEPTEDWLFALGWRYQDTPDRNIENSSTSRCSTFFCVSNFSFVDVKATRRFSDVAVSLGVDNVADDRAFVFHPYPGRTFLLEVAWDGGF
ncbi:MAG: TonB-dependent receptor, partial [Pseudomonadota bacterium]